MPVEFKCKVQKMNYSLWMTIPKEIGEYLELKEGDIVGVTLNDHEMVVKKK